MEDGRACSGSNDQSLDDMSVELLEQVLFDLMVVKYPGVERADLARLLKALNGGDLARVEEIEADIALKSAQWSRAVLNLDEQDG